MGRKIYNEIVIDMNPESSTFEDVLHEDSFIDNGEIAKLYRGGRAGSKERSYWDEDGIEYNLRWDGSTTKGTEFWVYRGDSGRYIGHGQKPSSLATMEAFAKGLVQQYGPEDGGVYMSHEAYVDRNKVFGEEGMSFGETGLEYSDLEGLTPELVFDKLVEKGFYPEGATFDQYEDDIMQMPIFEGVSEEDTAAAEAEVAEDVYGLEKDIERAEEDIGVASEGARSDIYGLQTQGAQQKRAGMFGKGLGGGMSQLAQQDASQAMRAGGQGIMSGLASEVRGQRRGIEDATVGLYGIGGSQADYDTQKAAFGADPLSEGRFQYEGGIGGVYGTGGSETTGIYNLEQAAEDDWEGDMEGWIAANS